MDLEHVKYDLLHLAIQIYLLSLQTQKACQSFTLKHDVFGVLRILSSSTNYSVTTF